MDMLAQGLALKKSFPSQLFLLKSRLESGDADLNVLIYGDSTATTAGGGAGAPGNTGWSRKFPEYIASRYPAWSARYWSTPNYGSGNYDSGGSLFQTGTGARTIHFYNPSVSGVNANMAFGAPNGMRLLTARGAAGIEIQMDFIFMSFGLNLFTTYGLENMAGQLMVAAQELRRLHPRAGILFLVQQPNPTDNANDDNFRAARMMCQAAGIEYVDVARLVLMAGKPAGWYQDYPHLGPVGQTAIINELRRLFDGCTHVGSLAPASSLTQDAANLIPNGRFDTFSAGVIGGFTSSNVTLEEETTDFVTGVRSIKGTVGTDASSYIDYQLSGPIMRELSGQIITLSAMVKLWAGHETSGPDSVGRLYMAYTGAPVSSAVQTRELVPATPTGAWQRVATAFRLPIISTYTNPLTLRYYFQNGAGVRGVSAVSGAGKVSYIDSLALHIGMKPFRVA